MPRLAGVPFFNEAVRIMFDSSFRLVAEPNTYTAQALTLLDMHEVAASHAWTKHYQYFGESSFSRCSTVDVRGTVFPFVLLTLASFRTRMGTSTCFLSVTFFALSLLRCHLELLPSSHSNIRGSLRHPISYLQSHHPSVPHISPSFASSRPSMSSFPYLTS